jgi:hypothetical protein
MEMRMMRVGLENGSGACESPCECAKCGHWCETDKPEVLCAEDGALICEECAPPEQRQHAAQRNDFQPIASEGRLSTEPW